VKGKGKIFFASDFHLGLTAGTNPLEREKRIIRWLDMAAAEASGIYLLGDVFDFWWEYRLVVPRGFTRFLGKLSSLTDSGIDVHFFTGNHDMWTFDYLSRECGLIVHKEPLTTKFDGHTFHLAHGEGLGSRSIIYRILLSIFRNKILQAMYSALHPALGVGFGLRWSLNSRLGKGVHLDFMGDLNEDLLRYSRTILEEQKIDHFIFGHRHLPLTYIMKEGPSVIFLGDWISSGSYAVWDGSELKLEEFI